MMESVVSHFSASTKVLTLSEPATWGVFTERPNPVLPPPHLTHPQCESTQGLPAPALLTPVQSFPTTSSEVTHCIFQIQDPFFFFFFYSSQNPATIHIF